MRKIRIIGDATGSIFTIKLIDANTGEELKNVKSCRLNIDADRPPFIATLLVLRLTPDGKSLLDPHLGSHIDEERAEVVEVVDVTATAVD